MLSNLEKLIQLIFGFINSIIGKIFSVQIDQKYTYFGFYVFILLSIVSIALIRKWFGLAVSTKMSKSMRTNTSRKGTNK